MVASDDRVKAALLALVAPDHARRELLVSVRGTVDRLVVDWVADLELWQEPFELSTEYGRPLVHAGFLSAWVQLRAGVLAALRAARRDWPGYRVMITGHSLGGSVAALMAAELAASGELRQADSRLYTFGQPRTGGADWARAYATLVPQTQRVVHDRDLVPHYPFRTDFWDGKRYDYEHPTPEVWLSENSSVRAVKCHGGEDPRCADSVPLLRWSGADHTSYFAPLNAGSCAA